MRLMARRVLADVNLERVRQTRRYDNAETVDGTGPETRWLLPYTNDSATEIEAALRGDYVDFEDEAPVTWVHLVREEVAEAFTETDPEALRAELIQVAALCVSWVEQIDHRAVTQMANKGVR